MKLKIKILCLAIFVSALVYWLQWTRWGRGKWSRVTPPPPSAVGRCLGAERHRPCTITADCSFRLGNHILTYWALLILARTNNCTAHLSPGMAQQLLPHFVLSATAVTPEDYWWTEWTFLLMSEALTKCPADFSGRNVHVYGFSTDKRYVLPFAEELRRELIFRPEVVERAQRKLRVIVRETQARILVSVHVRRGDFATDGTTLTSILQYFTTLPDARFYAAAMEHFRAAYRQVAFVVVSDDMKWCMQNIDNRSGDVHFAGDGTIEDPIHDFALLAHCNHSVIGISSFAYAAALMASGDVVYFTNNTYNIFEAGFFYIQPLDHWKLIAADLSHQQRSSPAIERLKSLLFRYMSQVFFYVLGIFSIVGTFVSPVFDVGQRLS